LNESSPHDVVLAALLVSSPPVGVDPRPDVEWRAALVVRALDEAGLLVKPPTGPPSADDLDALARWLAEESGHPRYTVPEQPPYPPGWTRLRQSETDVLVAYTAAAKGKQGEPLALLQQARDTLVHAVRTSA
jgi:hypothetical protein